MKRWGTITLAMFVSVALVVLVSGCGGGGGGGGAVPLKTSNIHLDNPGDYWIQATTMTISDVGDPPFSVSGDMTYTNMTTLVQNPYTDDWCIDNYYFGNLSGNIIEGNSYSQQDPDGTTYHFGDDDGWIIDPIAGYVLVMESPLALGQNHSFTVIYDNGDVFSHAYMVQAIDEVSCPLGTYEAYRVLTTQSKDDYSTGRSYTAVETHWFVPGLGSTVKYEGSATYFDEFDTIYRRATIEEVLRETNVSY